MATITSEMVTEYFSQLNLSTPAFMYLDEFAIYPTNLSAKYSQHLLDAIISNTIEPTFPKIDWTWWNTHYHRDWNAFLESNIELAAL